MVSPAAYGLKRRATGFPTQLPRGFAAGWVCYDPRFADMQWNAAVRYTAARERPEFTHVAVSERRDRQDEQLQSGRSISRRTPAQIVFASCRILDT